MLFTAFARDILGLELTLGQRVLARVAFDGADPCELEPDEREVASVLFGGAETIPAAARRRIVIRVGRRSGKTMLAAAFGVYRMATADLSMCGPGDKPAVAIFSPRREDSEIALGMSRAMIEGAPRLRARLRNPTARGFRLYRPDAERLVEFRVAVKGSRGGGARGRSWLAAIIDESEFVSPGDASKMMDAEIVAAVAPALTRGSPAILLSTPWPAESLTRRLFYANLGKPTTALAVHAPTLLMRDGDAELAERIESERAIDPTNALREYDAIETNADSAFFEASTIDDAIGEMPAARKALGTNALDLAFRYDSSAQVVVERHDGLVAVVYLDLISPRGGQPLKPSEVVGKFATKGRELGAQLTTADAHYLEVVREHADREGAQLVAAPSRETAFLYARDLFRERRVKIPGDPRLIAQLKSVSSKPLPGGGIAIVLPRSAGAGHADLVSALVSGLYWDRRHGPLVGVREAAVVPLQQPATFPGLHVRSAGSRGGFTRW